MEMFKMINSLVDFNGKWLFMTKGIVYIAHLYQHFFFVHYKFFLYTAISDVPCLSKTNNLKTERINGTLTGTTTQG